MSGSNGACREDDASKILLVGRGAMCLAIAKAIADTPGGGHRIVGAFRLPGEEGPAPEGIECLGETANFAEVIGGYDVDSVLICPDIGTRSEDARSVLEQCDQAGLPCHFVANFLHLENLTASSGEFAGMPAVALRFRRGSRAMLAIKRAMDIAGAALGLVFCLPVLASVAFAVMVYDRGPVLCRQIRVGRGGRRFLCYRFRCATVTGRGANTEGHVTPVGRLLRRFDIDALPQWINVLKGDMSLVGPRPPSPSEVSRYSVRQRRRISVRPGMTGLGQSGARNGSSFEKGIETDLFYIDNWSLWLDIKLMLGAHRA